MSVELAELAFLFGLKYLAYNFGVTKKDLYKSETIFGHQKDFLHKLKIILSNLLGASDLHYLSSCLRVTPYFLLLFNKNSCRSGLCLKCDAYFSQLDQHFYQYHRQALENYKQYRSMFGCQAETYWPIKTPKKQPSIRSQNYFTGYLTRKLNFGLGLKKSQLFKNKVKPSKRRPYKEKPKPKDMKNKKDQESFFKNSEYSESSNLEDLNSLSPQTFINHPSAQTKYTCGICFSQLRIDKRKLHNYEHKRNELVECYYCKKVFTRRVAKIHKRKCIGYSR